MAHEDGQAGYPRCPHTAVQFISRIIICIEAADSSISMGNRDCKKEEYMVLLKKGMRYSIQPSSGSGAERTSFSEKTARR